MTRSKHQDFRCTTIRRTAIASALTVIACLSLSSTAESQSLWRVFETDFRFGVAFDDAWLNDEASTQVVNLHFNSITTQDSLKWRPVHPFENSYRFDRTDRALEFAEANGLDFVGHTLLWHTSLPAWVFGNNPTEQVLLDRMENHITTVLTRYKGKLQSMDVVNEAVLVDGSLRASGFWKIIGNDYIRHAFAFAEAADPELELVYNDFQFVVDSKRKGIIQLIEALQAASVRIDAVGFQAHWRLDSPSIEDIETALVEIAATGVKINISELDIDVLPDGWPRRGENIIDMTAEDQAKYDPYAPHRGGIPYEILQQQANRYFELFQLFHKHADKIDRVTLWGLTDAKSWLNNYPIKGRTNYPLLFDRSNKPKPAFDLLIAFPGPLLAE